MNTVKYGIVPTLTTSLVRLVTSGYPTVCEELGLHRVIRERQQLQASRPQHVQEDTVGEKVGSADDT